MRDLGLKVVTVKGPQSFQDIRDAVNQVAAAIGEPAKGKDLVALMDKELRGFKKKWQPLTWKNGKSCSSLPDDFVRRSRMHL